MANKKRKERRESNDPINFTERRILDLPVPDEGEATYRDAEEKYLRLRILSSGRRSFYWWRKVYDKATGKSKPVYKTIGEFPTTISLKDARDKAKKFSVTLNDWKTSGYKDANPFERAKPVEPTYSFGELVESYVNSQILGHAAHPEAAAKRIRRSMVIYMKALKDLPLAGIARKDVLDLHARLGRERGKVTANRTVTFIRTVFNWAIEHEIWRGVNPARLNKKHFFKEEPRTRYLDGPEQLRLQNALDVEPSLDLRDYVALALFTGQRKRNVMSMNWSAISFEQQTWKIAKVKAKNKKEHIVHLDPSAMGILRERWEKRDKDSPSPWVFPSKTSESGHLEDLKRRWKDALKRADLYFPDDPELKITQHSLRHTFVSVIIMSGRSLAQAGEAVGHSSAQSTQRYAHLDKQVVQETVLAGKRQRELMMAAAEKKLKEQQRKLKAQLRKQRLLTA